MITCNFWAKREFGFVLIENWVVVASSICFGKVLKWLSICLSIYSMDHSKPKIDESFGRTVNIYFEWDKLLNILRWCSHFKLQVNKSNVSIILYAAIRFKINTNSLAKSGQITSIFAIWNFFAQINRLFSNSGRQLMTSINSLIPQSNHKLTSSPGLYTT